MISHAAATDIPMAHPIIPPNIAMVRKRNMRKYFEYDKMISTYIAYPQWYNVHPVYN